MNQEGPPKMRLPRNFCAPASSVSSRYSTRRALRSSEGNSHARVWAYDQTCVQVPSHEPPWSKDPSHAAKTGPSPSSGFGDSSTNPVVDRAAAMFAPIASTRTGSRVPP